MGGNCKPAVIGQEIVHQRCRELFRFGMEYVSGINLIKKPYGKILLVQIQRIDIPAVPHRVVEHLAICFYGVVNPCGTLFNGLNKFKLLHGTLACRLSVSYGYTLSARRYSYKA